MRNSIRRGSCVSRGLLLCAATALLGCNGGVEVEAGPQTRDALDRGIVAVDRLGAESEGWRELMPQLIEQLRAAGAGLIASELDDLLDDAIVRASVQGSCAIDHSLGYADLKVKVYLAALAEALRKEREQRGDDVVTSLEEFASKASEDLRNKRPPYICDWLGDRRLEVVWNEQEQKVVATKPELLIAQGYRLMEEREGFAVKITNEDKTEEMARPEALTTTSAIVQINTTYLPLRPNDWKLTLVWTANVGGTNDELISEELPILWRTELPSPPPEVVKKIWIEVRTKEEKDEEIGVEFVLYKDNQERGRLTNPDMSEGFAWPDDDKIAWEFDVAQPVDYGRQLRGMFTVRALQPPGEDYDWEAAFIVMGTTDHGTRVIFSQDEAWRHCFGDGNPNEKSWEFVW